MGSIRSNMVLVLLAVPMLARAGDRSESFDRDPGWEGLNNRSEHFAPRTIHQDFGYDPARGAIGGTITPAAEPAFYAKVIPDRTFDDRLTASGTLRCEPGGGHFLVGFFNAGTLNEWRTPNTIALRILGRGEVFYAYVEYATARWRAGGDSPRPFPRERDPITGKEQFRGFPAGVTHRWSLDYDPNGNAGRGVITATIGDATAVCELDLGHKDDGARFDRFGLLNVMKSADGPGVFQLDDLEVQGERSTFDSDPGWEGRGNRREFVSANVRPRFDFGFSPTRHAGGRAPGELGGLVFRGDCREPARLASYGDRVGPLTLRQPLRASGTIVLRRGVSDSTTLLGFYHHQRSLRVNPSQDSGYPECFLGFAVEGPSRDGFLVYPVTRSGEGRHAYADGPDRPAILPDGRPHRWSLAYEPGDGDHGRVVLTFDETRVPLDLPEDGDETTFDRFGIVTTWIDGNAQSIYFDDLTYTAGP